MTAFDRDRSFYKTSDDFPTIRQSYERRTSPLDLTEKTQGPATRFLAVHLVRPCGHAEKSMAQNPFTTWGGIGRVVDPRTMVGC